MDFIPFDYKQPPEDGVYWVAGKRPQFEISADLYGEPTGSLTGVEDHYTALVWIRTGEQGMVDFGVIDRINLGEVDPLDQVTHYAPFAPLPSAGFAFSEANRSGVALVPAWVSAGWP